MLNRIQLFLLFVFAISTVPLKAADLEVRCVGPEDADVNLVYLHGILGRHPMRMQYYSYQHLFKVAKKLKIRFAVPLSQSPCRTNENQLCWPHYTTEGRELALTWIQKSAEKCFKKEAKYSIVGFSNGGYLAAKLMQYCHENAAEWILAIGAAPDIDTDISDGHLHYCGTMYVAAGVQDGVFLDAQSYVRTLQENWGDVQFFEYPNMHDLTAADLTLLIQNIQKVRSASTPSASGS